MRALARAITVVDWVLVGIGMLIILVGTLGVILKEGWEGYQRLESPFNVLNFAMKVAVLLPGIVLVALGNRLRNRSREPEQ